MLLWGKCGKNIYLSHERKPWMFLQISYVIPSLYPSFPSSIHPSIHPFIQKASGSISGISSLLQASCQSSVSCFVCVWGWERKGKDTYDLTLGCHFPSGPETQNLLRKQQARDSPSQEGRGEPGTCFIQ